MKGRKIHSNLTPEETQAIESLRKNKSIVILPADKGGALVIQNRSTYVEIAKEHLSSVDTGGNKVYEEVECDITKDISVQVNHVIDEAHLLNVIDEDTTQ